MEGKRLFHSECGALGSWVTSAAIQQPTWRNIPKTWTFNRFLAPDCSLPVRNSQGCRIFDNWFSLIIAQKLWMFDTHIVCFFFKFLYIFYQENFLCVTICFLVFEATLCLQALQIQTHIFVCISCFRNGGKCFLQFTLLDVGKFVVNLLC